MVLIPGGETLMGTDEPGIPPDGEGPQRPVVLDPFLMDTQEVSNLQFLRAPAHAPPRLPASPVFFVRLAAFRR